jgi:hypothetical protein
MDEIPEIPFYQKPSFRSIVLAVLLFGIYIYEILYQGGVWDNFLGIAFDLVLLVLLFQVCVFFYAQFILPIHTLEGRRKIVTRLWMYARNAHGPAIFVKNGRKVERAGESEKRGAGLLWVDTASAVVTRTLTTFKQVLGPGVHFLDANEKIATVLSLHIQTHTFGPSPNDTPFEKLKENPTEEEIRSYEAMQARCMSVRAMTRDGIEVIPRISVTFKIDANPAAPGEKGSHFGFNAEAVKKAAHSEGISTEPVSEESRRVAWNQLPALMTAELCREYLSKFTLSELFEACLPPLPDILQPEAPPAPFNMPKTPLLVKRGFAARLLRKINNSLEGRLDQLIPKEQPALEQPDLSQKLLLARKSGKSSQQTALQIINQMLKARMSQAVIPKFDECGRLLEGHQISEEYRKLKNRGIAVLDAGVSALYFNPTVEAQLIERWTTNWLSNARIDRGRIERLNLAAAEKGRQSAVLGHALVLSEAINKDKPANISAAVKSLLQKTESEIRANDRLFSRINNELETLDSLSRWLDSREP